MSNMTYKEKEMKVNKEYIIKEATQYYKTEGRTEIYENLANDIGVGTRTITRFMATEYLNTTTVLGIQKLLNLDPSKMFILE